MEITIETASPRQLDELYRVEQESFGKEAWSRQQLGYLLSDYNTVSLVARADGEIAGFVICEVEAEDSMLVGHVLTLDVLPGCRRRGVAQRLILEVEDLFRARGIRESKLEVRIDNTAALGLYRKLGYVVVAQLDHYYRSAHGLYLKKAL